MKVEFLFNGIIQLAWNENKEPIGFCFFDKYCYTIFDGFTILKD